MQDCIVALATASGKGSVAIVRFSGEGSVDIANQLFQATQGIPVTEFVPYKMYTGHIDCQKFYDFGYAVYFKAPKSFTGEDTVELHCHGGTAIAQAILKQATQLGARLAERGEYTKRAFLNGKLSLSSVEGLIYMINSESEAEVRAGASLYAEQLTKFVRKIQDKLTEILASIEADIDFPEEDIEATALCDAKADLEDIYKNLQEKIASYYIGQKIKNGVRVLLVGRPNAGKSSLLNRLLQQERAIVSSMQGTTRDIIEADIEIEGIKFILTDTAGLRESTDEIERIGINRAKQALKAANIVLYLIDASVGYQQEDRELLIEMPNTKKILIYNKVDIINDKKANKCDVNNFDDYLEISAQTGQNIDKLRKMLYKYASDGYQIADTFIIEERHYSALTKASRALLEGINICGLVPPDLLSIHLKECWQALGEITGETANESIISEIFEKFCVGK